MRMLLFVADLSDEDESFETEVLSDTRLIALDVYAKFWDYLESNDIELSRDASFSSFTEKFDDRVSGWQMEIDVRQFYSKDDCQVPEYVVEQEPVNQAYITTSLGDEKIFLEDLEESELFFISGAGVNSPLQILGQLPGMELWDPQTSTWEIFAGFSIGVSDSTFQTGSIYKVRLSTSAGATAGEGNKLYIIDAKGITYEKDFILT